MSAPLPGPQSPSLAAAVDSLSLQVNRNTVLQARAVLLGEALRLREALLLHTPTEGVGRCGGDPVSADASSAFTERVAALMQYCHRYTAELETAAHSLEETAMSYGYTEEDIASYFSGS